MTAGEHLHPCGEEGCSNPATCWDECDEEIQSIGYCDEHGGIVRTFGGDDSTN